MHHIQRAIVFKLTRSTGSRFADIKPKELDGNVFTYHLKQLMAEKIVEKNDSGRYQLSRKGRLTGINILVDNKNALEQAHCVLFMTVRNKKGEWFLRRRLVHPMHGRVGFLHCEPVANEDIHKSAEREFETKTGLKTKFKVRGSGFVQLNIDGQLESFTQFTVMDGGVVDGKLQSPGDSGENFWYSGNFDEPEIFPNMPDLIKHLEKSKGFFFLNQHFDL